MVGIDGLQMQFIVENDRRRIEVSLDRTVQKYISSAYPSAPHVFSTSVLSQALASTNGITFSLYSEYNGGVILFQENK